MYRNPNQTPLQITEGAVQWTVLRQPGRRQCVSILEYNDVSFHNGARCSVVVKALCYKPEGRGFDFRLGEFLNLPNPSGSTRPWGLLIL
jgi:hypothetical protein